MLLPNLKTKKLFFSNFGLYLSDIVEEVVVVAVNQVKRAMGINCQFNQIEGSSVQTQLVTSGSSIQVSCDEAGYYGGGNWYCKFNGSFDGKSCEKYTYSISSYAKEGFHCDLNEDGIVDDGESINFPDHSFVSKWRVPEGRPFILSFQSSKMNDLIFMLIGEMASALV